MNETTLHRPDESRAGLWFGLLGGAGAWTAHLLLAYLIAEFACVAEKDDAQWLGIMLPAWWLIAMSAAMLMISAGAAWIARRASARLQRETQPENRALITDRYMARTGYIMSGLFTFIIAVESIPIFFYLQSC